MPDHSATDTPGGTASERRDEAAPVRAERARRDAMWAALLNAGGPDSVPPSVLRELPIYGRQQGILGDLTRTKDVAPGGAGVAAALLHTGRHYADELDDDGLRYHYPVTGRLGQRDANEVEAKRNACRLGIPVFVITQPTHATRSVRRAWVASWDDEQAAFLVSFGEQPTAAPQPADDAEFVLEQKAPPIQAQVPVRPGQRRFRFLVLQRYGVRSALCGVANERLLDAPHLRPKSKNGTDDPRNGLPLCATHHRALDAGLVRINPGALRVEATGAGGLGSLGVTEVSIAHLRELPHRDAHLGVRAPEGQLISLAQPARRRPLRPVM